MLTAAVRFAGRARVLCEAARAGPLLSRRGTASGPVAPQSQEKEVVKLTVNGQEVTVSAGTSILHAAQKAGVTIPTLCYHPTLPVTGSCRICLCKNKTKNKLVPACATPVEGEMEIEANTPELDASVKGILELILSRHPDSCSTCEVSGRCDLQNLFYNYQVDNKYPKRLSDLTHHIEEEAQRDRHSVGQLPGHEGLKSNTNPAHSPPTIDLSSPSIVIDPKKCILCMRCVRACSYLQKMDILGTSGRGADEHISTVGHVPLPGTQCISCGACTRVCPTGAIIERPHIHSVFHWLRNKVGVSGRRKVIIVQCAPSVRVALAEELGMDAGGVKTGQMVQALRTLGFDYVYDTNVSADLTTVEEAHELVDRIKNKGVLPMFTSCCPAWVNLVEQTYPSLLPNLSSCKSPQQMLGALLKRHVATNLPTSDTPVSPEGQHEGVRPDDIVHVAVMPCVAKKGEAARPEFRTKVAGHDYSVPDVDYVLTTRELGHMLRVANIHAASLKESAFDSPLGTATNSGAIFGATGGVMEAALRTAHFILTGRNLPALVYEPVRGLEELKEASVTIDLGPQSPVDSEPHTLVVKVAVANGGRAMKHVVEQVLSGKSDYHFVEMMACAGGCIGGGGMPKSLDPDILKKRSKAIYSEAERATLRYAHESPEVKKLYTDVYHAPNSHEAHHDLHTHYEDRSKDHDK